MNEITMSAPDINEVVTIGGEEYMRYKPSLWITASSGEPMWMNTAI